uniref:Mitochondrial ribosomal protein L12 n=1 Tax=Leptobrachium leishanense TaxID=445787 RepID=A0A8C5QPA7_9ANUR
MFPVARCCLRLRAAASSGCRLETSVTRLLSTSSHRRNEAVAAPSLDNGAKQYPMKIQQLVDQIAGLTLLEVSDLNELLKKTLKIPDVGMMPMGTAMPGAAAPAQPVEEDAPAKKEKTHFTVKLMESNAVDKVKLIKEVKNCMQGLNLVQVRGATTKNHKHTPYDTSLGHVFLLTTTW